MTRCGVDLSGSGMAPLEGCCEHGDEPLVCIKGGGISCLAE